MLYPDKRRLVEPRVSVLMAVYNTPPEYLREAIDSILAQTFTDFEFLILNDGSTDPQVEELVTSYSDPRIVYTVNEQNLGISETRNRLLDMARGEYLAIMDHDDISLPERFEKQVAFLNAHPEVGVVNTQYQSIGQNKVSTVALDDISIKMELMVRCCLRHSSCMLRRSVLAENGIRYEAMFSPVEDYALFCRLLPLTRFAILPDVLLRYRAWDGNTSHTQAKRMEVAAQGVLAFVRRDNPELWAMAQTHLCRIWRYRLCGVPILAKERTRGDTTWKFFGLPVWRVKESLPRWKA